MDRQNQLSSLETLKKKASDCARTDRIGHVFARTFDLIGGAARDGVEAESVREISEMLEQDRNFAMNKDNKELVPLIHAPRDLVYGLIESLGAAFDILAEKKTVELLKDETLHTSTDQALNGPSVIENRAVVPREDPDLLRLYHELGNMPQQDAALDHSVKEEIAEDAHELVNLNQHLISPKEEEEADLFDAGFLDIAEGRVPVLGGGVEGMGLHPGAREEDIEEKEEETATSQQPAKRRRLSKPSPAISSTASAATLRLSAAASSAANPSTAAAKRKGRSYVAAAATPIRSGSDKKAYSNSTPSASGSKKKYACDECSHVAVYPNHLIIHKRVHTGDRPFKCTFDDCTATFISQSNLNVHIRSKAHMNAKNVDIN